MKTLDVTFDFETCSLLPTAAVISIGAVAWDRYGANTPFILTETGGIDKTMMFYKHVDLRSQFLDGFRFDQETANWWSKQDEKAKASLLDYDEEPLVSIKEVIDSFFSWITHTVERVGAESVCLWSQGTDFDVAILKNICAKYGLEIPVKYQNFRDHRTFVMESGSRVLASKENGYRNLAAEDTKHVYGMIPALRNTIMSAQSHNPLYDCAKSINSTWYMMQECGK